MQKINGTKYLFDNKTGAMQKGLSQYQGKTYYFNNDGRMFTGEKHLNSHWSYFDANTGARATGFKTIPAGSSNKTVYYNSNGQMKYGQHKVNGHFYNFDRVTGKMSTGLTYLKDQKKTVYYNPQGQMQYGM